ncbi:hypothetical protein BSE24067_07213 [Burkholderia seminalis]|nr:hypothetical protein BSE24067_07213 [Burkholderia seminalis]
MSRSISVCGRLPAKPSSRARRSAVRLSHTLSDQARGSRAMPARSRRTARCSRRRLVPGSPGNTSAKISAPNAMPSMVASALFRNAASPMRAVLSGDVKFQKKIANALPIAAVRG